MFCVRGLVEGLGLFEGNRVPLELKILGIAFYIQMSSLRSMLGCCLKCIRFLRLLSGS